MANSIDLVTVFRNLMDEVYKLESVTAKFDALTQSPISFDGTSVVKVMKLSTVGLGTYSRASGYPAGNITATWEAMTLSCERARAFTIDRMDNEESLGLVLGNLMRTWMREQVAPEIDAYRFAKYCQTASILSATPATLSASTVLAALDAAKKAMNTEQVPSDGRTLFVSEEVMSYLEASVTRVLTNENGVDRRVTSFDGMPVVMVPQTRFYTKIDLNAGATPDAGGYIKNVATGKDINFMIIHNGAPLQATKLNQVKYFSPEVNQVSDGHLWMYRIYHDAFVYDNKVKGIYLHNKA